MSIIRFVVTAALVAGLLLVVSTLGLEASPEDHTLLFKQPKRVFRSLISMLVVMPIAALTLASVFNLDRAVKIAMVALSLSPVPPFLPARNIRAGGEPSYAIGLLIVTSLVSIVYVPLALALIEFVFHIPLGLSIAHVIVPIGWSVILPVIAGLLVKRFAPRAAARITRPAGRLAAVLFVVGLIPLIVESFARALPLAGTGAFLAMLVLCVVGLCAGHLLGEGTPGDRATLAMSTAARHPGVAMAIAKANFPDETLVFPAVVVYVVIAALVSLPYLKWATQTREGFRAPSANPSPDA